MLKCAWFWWKKADKDTPVRYLTSTEQVQIVEMPPEDVQSPEEPSLEDLF